MMNLLYSLWWNLYDRIYWPVLCILLLTLLTMICRYCAFGWADMLLVPAVVLSVVASALNVLVPLTWLVWMLLIAIFVNLINLFEGIISLCDGCIAHRIKNHNGFRKGMHKTGVSMLLYPGLVDKSDSESDGGESSKVSIKS